MLLLHQTLAEKLPIRAILILNEVSVPILYSDHVSKFEIPKRKISVWMQKSKGVWVARDEAMSLSDTLSDVQVIE